MSRRHSTRARGGKRVTKTSKAAADKKRARVWFSGKKTDPRPAVEQIVNEKDPRKRWQMEQAAVAAEMVRLATADGERQARRDWELGRRTPSQTIGCGELLDVLARDGER